MKKWNRAVLSVVAASLLLATPVWANTNPGQGMPPANEETQFPPEMQKALQKVYGIAPHIKELKLQHVNFQKGNEYAPDAWYLHFTNAPQNLAPNDTKEYAFATVELDAKTGELRRMYSDNPVKRTEEHVSSEAAKEKAKDFLAQVRGNVEGKYQVNDLVFHNKIGSKKQDGTMTFWRTSLVQFDRLVNGIPLANNGITITLDGHGNVTGYEPYGRNNLDITKFPKPTDVISKAKAEEAYLKNAKARLDYNGFFPKDWFNYDPSASDTMAVLKYSISTEFMIDAKSGKAVTNFVPFTPIEPEKTPMNGKGKKLIAKNKEEIVKLLADHFQVNMSGLAFTENPDIDGPVNSKIKYYAWQSTPVKNEKGEVSYEKMIYVHVAVQEDTGEVLSFNLQREWAPENNNGVKVSKEEAMKKAVAALNEFLDPSIKELELSFVYDPQNIAIVPDWVDQETKESAKKYVTPEYAFNFQGLHNGVPVEERRYFVRVDAITGDVIGFGVPQQDVFKTKLPDNKNIITADEAAKTFLKENPLRLTYTWPEYNNQLAPAPLLVYSPQYVGYPGYVDALTGKINSPFTEK
ncbi:YcdB/YcdC domain-containing protein [Brevibacillus sp. SYSU BS000544]|uniref:YcdB/YcdC domain-containing protein n=1 Tax=Brevibacillus sp. SYSU BS000544 TaxID=3416443 RepID=UPI003CE4DA53